MGGIFSTPGQLALEGRLADLIAQRAVLADAVANVDTPGYQPAQAATFAPALSAAIQAQMGASAPGATPGATSGTAAGATGTQLSTASGSSAPTSSAAFTAAAASTPAVGVPAPGAVTPDGNGVGLDATMVSLAQNDLDYQAVVRQIQLVYQNLSTAIDAGGA